MSKHSKFSLVVPATKGNDGQDSNPSASNQSDSDIPVGGGGGGPF
jgi:hypothetical protein